MLSVSFLLCANCITFKYIKRHHTMYLYTSHNSMVQYRRHIIYNNLLYSFNSHAGEVYFSIKCTFLPFKQYCNARTISNDRKDRTTTIGDIYGEETCLQKGNSFENKYVCLT